MRLWCVCAYVCVCVRICACLCACMQYNKPTHLKQGGPMATMCGPCMYTEVPTQVYNMCTTHGLREVGCCTLVARRLQLSPVR